MIDMQNNVSKNNLNASKLSSYDDLQPQNAHISGKILSKNGKNMRIETKAGELYDLITKTDIDIKKGQTLEIKRSQLDMIKKVDDEKLDEEKVEKEKEEKELQELDLKPTKENLDAIESLKKYGIPVTKENVKKFALIKSSIKDIKDGLNFENISQLLLSGTDLSNLSVSDVSSMVKKLDQSKAVSLKGFQKYKAMSYDQARKKAKEIYGSQMGKDIQDIIIAIDKNGGDITKENIDQIHDVFSKLYDIKDIDNGIIAKVSSSGGDISINSLYNTKNLVFSSEITASASAKELNIVSYKGKINADDIEKMTKQAKEILAQMGLDPEEYQAIVKDLIKSGYDLDKDTIVDIGEVNQAIAKLTGLLDKNTAALLMQDNTDIANMDIKELLMLVEQIKQQMSQEQLNLVSKEDMDIGKGLLKALSSIKLSTVLSTNYTLKNFLFNSPDGRNFYNNYLFPRHKGYENYSKLGLSISETHIIKQTLILSSIEDIDFSKIDLRRNNISLMHIAKTQGFFDADFDEPMSQTKLVKLNYVSSTMDINLAKQEIKAHFEFMRSNMRAVHVKNMIDSGIDSLRSDIRLIAPMLEAEISKSRETLSVFKAIDTVDMNKFAARAVIEEENPNFRKLSKFMELSTNNNSYYDELQKMLEKAKKYKFDEVSGKIENINQKLAKFDVTKDGVKESMLYLYKSLKDIDKLIDISHRPDKQLLQKQSDEIKENIKKSSELSKNDFIQIPFSMEQGGSNANVYAKTAGNSQSKKIDPENMSILVDLNTKKLGKAGFFIKVNKKDITLKISGSKNSAAKLKENIAGLSKSFETIGYNLHTVDVVTPENKSKILFFEDEVKSQGMINMMV